MKTILLSDIHRRKQYGHIKYYIQTEVPMTFAHSLIFAFQMIHYKLPHEILCEDSVTMEQVLDCWKFIRHNDDVRIATNKNMYLDHDEEIELFSNWEHLNFLKSNNESLLFSHDIAPTLPSELRKVLFKFDIELAEGKYPYFKDFNHNIDTKFLKQVLLNNAIPQNLKNVENENVGGIPLWVDNCSYSVFNKIFTEKIS